MPEKSIEQRAAEAELLLQTQLPGATCVPQEWDERVDCWVKLPDGSLVGEKIPLPELSERRVLAAGERLKQRIEGHSNSLINEILPPTRLGAPSAWRAPDDLIDKNDRGGDE